MRSGSGMGSGISSGAANEKVEC